MVADQTMVRDVVTAVRQAYADEVYTSLCVILADYLAAKVVLLMGFRGFRKLPEEGGKFVLLFINELQRYHKRKLIWVELEIFGK